MEKEGVSYILHLRQNNESGMVLIVTMVVTFITTILAGSFLSMTIYESRHSIWQKHRAQSLFIAEAGVERALYYLNNTDDNDNPWVDGDGQIKTGVLDDQETLAEGNYDVTLFSPSDKPWLPANSYLVESEGIIPRTNSAHIKQGVACILRKLNGIPIPAALSILDEADPEDEALKFQSAVWTIDGRDHDANGNLIMVNNQGLPGIAVANDGDDVPHQLDKFPDKPKRLDQVKGMRDTDGDGDLDYVEAMEAIIEDTDLPKNLDAYANYFRRIAIDISGPEFEMHHAQMGMPDDYVILYADLTQGNKKVAGLTTGYGVLVLGGVGEFEMAGNSTWNGLIICAADSYISLKGGGNVPAHINGALMIANGTVEMNGTADVKYSSETIAKINSWLLLYQVYAWCGGWGEALGSDNYWPIASGDTGGDASTGW